MQRKAEFQYQDKIFRYIKPLLEALDCTNIQYQIRGGEIKRPMLISFDNSAVKPEEFVRLIFPTYAFINCYQTDNHYFLSVSEWKLKKEMVVSCMFTYFNLVNANRSEVLKEKDFIPYGHRLTDTEFHLIRFELRGFEDDEKFLSPETVFKEEFKNLLAKQGLALEYDIDTEPHYITIKEPELFAESTTVKDLKERAGFLRLQKLAFFMGDHPRLGKESDTQVFFRNTISDLKLSREIFSFINTTPKTGADTTSKLYYNYFKLAEPYKINPKSESKGDSKNEDPILLEKLNKKLESLESEYTKKQVPLKYRKLMFLDLIKTIHELNPGFSLRTCVICAEQEAPQAFYKAAMQGMFSKTRKLIEEILETEPRKTCKP